MSVCRSFFWVFKGLFFVNFNLVNVVGVKKFILIVLLFFMIFVELIVFSNFLLVGFLIGKKLYFIFKSKLVSCELFI